METLPANVVPVWSVDLDTAFAAGLPSILTATEQERATRFRFEADARRWTTGRKILRLLLAQYTGSSPADLAFSYGPCGKPALQNSVPDTPHFLRFNVSHSQSQLCVAVARDREVGVDIEQVRTNFAPVELAESCFSLPERKALNELPLDAQFALFFQLWTSKEAYVKARGLGLSFPLDQLTLLPHPPGVMVHVIDKTPQSASLPSIQMAQLSLSPGYAAALAVEGKSDYQIVHREWDSGFSMNP